MSKAVPSRQPPAPVAASLRREVNFGCPIRYPTGGGCGCPILTYHHFDPPWAGNFTHHPDGMIALCGPHHTQADGGTWTNQQLRDFKKNPYVDRVVRLHWGGIWTFEKLLVRVADSLVVGEGSPITLAGNPVFRFQSADVPDLGAKIILFDSQIQDRSGQDWLTIKDNIFSLDVTNLIDLSFNPSTTEFKARHDDGTKLFVRHRLFNKWQFLIWWSDFDRKKRHGSAEKFISTHDIVDSDGNIRIMTLTGDFFTNNVDVIIKKNYMRTKFHLESYKEDVTFPGIVTDSERPMTFFGHNGEEIFRIG